MPRTIAPLLASQIKNLPEGKTVAVGGVTGLYFRKAKYQSLFILRYTDASGRHDLSIGTYPQIGLAEARQIALTVRARIAAGKNVIAERQKKQQRAQVAAKLAPKIRTFAEIARAWIKERSEVNYWQNDIKGEARANSILEMHVFPHIGNKNIDLVTVDDIYELLKLIWTTKHSTATKAKTYICKVFQWAIARKLCKRVDNPGDMRSSLGILMEPLQKHKHVSRHHAACPIDEIPRLFAELKRYASVSARACEFGILTCARSKAIRMATWDEIDLNEKIWTIPIEHDKIKTEGRDRRIFLSDQAITVLKSLPKFPGSRVLFPNLRGAPLSDAALTMFLRGMHDARFALDGRGWIDQTAKKRSGNPAVITLHGTARASFRTWAKDDALGNNRLFDQEAVELCLLHAKNDAYKGAYDRATLDNERRMVMAAWGKYCFSERESLCIFHQSVHGVSSETCTDSAIRARAENVRACTRNG